MWTVLASQCVAYPGDHAVPLAFFRGGIIDQYAIYGAAAAVAAVVPDPVLANAGHGKEIRCDPLVDDAGRRLHLGQERRGRIVPGIGNGLHRQVGAAVFGEKPPPGSAFGRSGVAGEDRDWHVDAGPGARDRVSPPFGVAGKGERGSEDPDDGEGSGQAVRTHGTVSDWIRNNEIDWRSFRPR